MDIDTQEVVEPVDPEPVVTGKPWYVYLLITDDLNATYVGATVDPDRRLRQHNGELVGGAKATTARSSAGRKWQRVCYVSGFPDNHAALQFEWRWKSLSRRKDIEGRTLVRRLKALKILMELDRPTSRAQLYSSYLTPPQIHWSMLEAEEEFSLISVKKKLI